MSSSPESEAGDDGSSPWPFLAALAIIVVVLIVVGLLTLTGGDGRSDEQRVVRAAVAQNDALQREDYADYRGYSCAAMAGDEADVLARQRSSIKKQGARYVDDVTGVSIDGDLATATVTYHFEKTPDSKIEARVPFAREDGTWKVCSAGPG